VDISRCLMPFHVRTACQIYQENSILYEMYLSHNLAFYGRM